MENTDGEVSDLIEKLKKNKIKPKEIIKTLDEKRLSEKAVLKGGAFIYLIWIVPCFLPAIAKYSHWEFLSFLNKLYAIEFPNFTIYLAIAFFIAAIPLTFWGAQYNKKKGGCCSEDYTIVLFKSGPYKILRHPSHLAWSIFFITLPIFLSKWVPFTLLSIIGIVAMVSISYYVSILEEKKLNLRKWGNEYRQYMKEVPRWNIILGLWRLRKNK